MSTQTESKVAPMTFVAPADRWLHVWPTVGEKALCGEPYPARGSVSRNDGRKCPDCLRVYDDHFRVSE